MKDKKSNRPSVGAPGRPEESGAFEACCDSTANSTISPLQRQGVHIADLLSHGAESGKTITDLQRLTDWKSWEIRKQIEHERRSGTLILSDNRNGYFLSDDPAEAQRFARSMRHRAQEILRTARAIEEAAGID